MNRRGAVCSAPVRHGDLARPLSSIIISGPRSAPRSEDATLVCTMIATPIPPPLSPIKFHRPASRRSHTDACSTQPPTNRADRAPGGHRTRRGAERNRQEKFITTGLRRLKPAFLSRLEPLAADHMVTGSGLPGAAGGDYEATRKNFANRELGLPTSHNDKILTKSAKAFGFEP